MGIKQRHSRMAMTTVQSIPENAEMLPDSIMPTTVKKLIVQTIPLIILSAKMIALNAVESMLSEREAMRFATVCFLVLDM